MRKLDSKTLSFQMSMGVDNSARQVTLGGVWQSARGVKQESNWFTTVKLCLNFESDKRTLKDKSKTSSHKL